MRIFVDTNVIISAILFPRTKIAEVFAVILQRHQLIISNYVIDELKQVFTNKFADKLKILDKFLDTISYELAEVNDPLDNTKYPQIRDECDLPILAGAIESKADVLITGDKDFEGIEVKGLEILKPATFIGRYRNE